MSSLHYFLLLFILIISVFIIYYIFFNKTDKFNIIITQENPLINFVPPDNIDNNNYYLKTSNIPHPNYNILQSDISIPNIYDHDNNPHTPNLPIDILLTTFQSNKNKKIQSENILNKLSTSPEFINNNNKLSTSPEFINNNNNNNGNIDNSKCTFERFYKGECSQL
jgi:hypothetical protein